MKSTDTYPNICINGTTLTNVLATTLERALHITLDTFMNDLRTEGAGYTKELRAEIKAFLAHGYDLLTLLDEEPNS
jgi:hypothetical protein